MNNKVDKLFKDKLEEHSLQPSAQAWEKVEAHLGKKNKMVLWRVAAAVVLLGVLTFAGLNWNDEPVTEIANEEVKKPVDNEIKSEPVKKPVLTTPQTIKETPKVAKKKTITPAAPVAPVAEEPVIEQTVAVAEIIEPQKEIKKEEKGITLTYSLPSIKKDEPVVAEVQPKKTGLERVLEIAKEVKNADSPLAELREAKNDILAFEFKKDKNKKH